MKKTLVSIDTKLTSIYNEIHESFINIYIRDSYKTAHNRLQDICSNFEKYLALGKPEFFPEYTDHNEKHYLDVINTSAELINEDSYKFLSSHDIYIYILSVFFHDIGMNMTAITFRGMMFENKYDNIPNYNFDSTEKRWSELWQVYILSLKKMSSDLKIRKFGKDFLIYEDEDNIIDSKNEFVNLEKLSDCLSFDDLNKTERKIIGEFIRQHHSRIGYEFALKGIYRGEEEEFKKFKVNDENFYDILDGVSSSEKALIGIIARSHGIEVSNTFECLTNVFGKLGWKKPLNIHVIFLMCVLRVSDYFQITSTRSLNPLMLSLKNIKTPDSLIQHNIHNCIERVHGLDDNETVNVHASPTDPQIFYFIENLLHSIQNELDSSFEILSENYHPSVRPMLKYRKITSNIFSKSVKNNLNYHPTPLSFKTESNILKLLIEPLYSNDIFIGFRELTQNSIDACKEKKFLIERELVNIEVEYKPLIKIDINSKKVIIEDNGTGMGIEEIEKYYLSTGAVYKTEDVYKKLIDKKDINYEENGYYRIGRFGIGVLASFLIGDKIVVKTKKINNEYEYNFTYEKSQTHINVYKNKTKKTILESFTIIEIDLSKKDYDRLKIDKILSLRNEIEELNSILNIETGKTIFNHPNLREGNSISSIKNRLNILKTNFESLIIDFKWYYGNDVEIQLHGINLNSVNVVNKNNLITCKDLHGITFEFTGASGTAPNLYYNDIILKKIDTEVKFTEQYGFLRFPKEVFIKDPNSLFPLKIQRNGVDIKDFNIIPIIIEIINDFFGKIIQKEIKNPFNKPLNLLDTNGSFNHQNFISDYKHGDKPIFPMTYIYTPKGYILKNDLFNLKERLNEIDIDKFLIIESNLQITLPISIKENCIFVIDKIDESVKKRGRIEIKSLELPFSSKEIQAIEGEIITQDNKSNFIAGLNVFSFASIGSEKVSFDEIFILNDHDNFEEIDKDIVNYGVLDKLKKPLLQEFNESKKVFFRKTNIKLEFLKSIKIDKYRINNKSQNFTMDFVLLNKSEFLNFISGYQNPFKNIKNEDIQNCIKENLNKVIFLNYNS